MFLTDASLFINGNNNAISAKTLINDCIKELSSFDFDGSSDCSELKSNLSECKIEDLITRIDTSKEDLLKLDNDFAQQYISLLAQYYNNSSLDTSRMTDEEKMQYNIQMDSLERNYYTSLLIMLEDYESRDLLTDEMKKQLDFTRVKVEQYGIRDKMSVLSEDAEGYLELFETFANYDRKLIKLNPELDENKKATLLSNYETEYNSLYDRLKDAREKRVTKEQGMAELAQLQKEMDENNGWIHPILENEYKEKILDKKIELGIATQSEIDYKNMDGWNRFWTDTGTFVASAYTGLYSIVEGAEDGVVMLGGKVGICDKDWASEFVKKDRSAELYDGIVLSTGMNTYSAYSKVHDVGEFTGELVGRVGMSFACPWANAIISGVSALGSTSQDKLNQGYDFDTAFNYGVLDGVVKGAEAYTFSQFNASVRNAGGFKNMFSATKEITKSLKGSGGITQFVKNAKTLAGPTFKTALKQTFNTTVKDPFFWIPTGAHIIENNYTSYLNGDFSDPSRFGKALLSNTWKLTTDVAGQFAGRFAVNSLQTFKTAMRGKNLADKISSSTAQATTIEYYRPGKGNPATSTIVDNITFDGVSSLEMLDDTYDYILTKNYQYDLNSPEGIAASQAIRQANAEKIYSSVDKSVKAQISALDGVEIDPQIESCHVRQDGSAVVRYRYEGGEPHMSILDSSSVRSTLNFATLDTTQEVLSKFTPNGITFGGNGTIAHHYYSNPAKPLDDLKYILGIGKDNE